MLNVVLFMHFLLVVTFVDNHSFSFSAPDVDETEGCREGQKGVLIILILIRFGNYFIQNRAREFATGYPNYGDPITNIILTKFTKQNDITKLIKMCQCNKTANNS